MPRRKAPAVRANRAAIDLGPLIGPRVVEGPPAPDGLLPLMVEAWDRFWSSPRHEPHCVRLWVTHCIHL